MLKIMFTKVLMAVMAVTVVFSTFFVASCTPEIKNKATFFLKNGETVQTIVVNVDDFSNEATVYDVMESKKYKTQFGADWGKDFYLLSLNGLVPDEVKGEWVGFYCSLEEYNINEDWALPVVYNEKTYYVTNNGPKQLPLIEDAEYLFSMNVYVG